MHVQQKKVQLGTLDTRHISAWIKTVDIVHSVEVPAANVHDVEVTPKLLTGEEDTVHGDSGYIGAEKREDVIIKNKKG